MNAANDIRETREKQGVEESVHYILKDHLGSWMTITDADGNVEQELSYDAWGSLRNPTTWSGDFSGTPVFDRGFTGHEHLAAFGLINMNGRCYDPLTSSFLSVDAYVQDPTSAQSFNRYAYCMHNPLRYTDPTGWLPDAPSPIRHSNGANHNPEAYWYSNDLNDVLWGRSVHPCETGNPKSIACTSSGYTIGNALVVGGNGSLSQLQAIRAYQNNPNLMTSMALEKMGIDVTIGCTYCNYMGMDGFLASMYNWTDASGQAYYAQTFEYVGGDRNCFYITGNEPSSSFWNENLDIAGKMLSTGGTYTYVESVLHYSEVLGKWMDKQGKRRPLSDKGGKYIGGKLKYGKAISNTFRRASTGINTIGIGLSVYEYSTATNTDDRIKYASDIVFGIIGFAEGGPILSAFWFLGGRELVFQYGKNMGELMKDGINPGYPVYQPFK